MTNASSIGGFNVVNRRGQVLLATVNEATIVPFVSGQLNNLKLAVNLVKRENLPSVENLVNILFYVNLFFFRLILEINRVNLPGTAIGYRTRYLL
ncbi:hypothetical protein NC652_035740 [Populus alba x Populus x berolinensis]|uniref:Clathrin heavy chain linker core motif domain-containing protein n=1 Tax=Populus alba x Populus x berolinensis TaxID=444605 RepID=A0AAD6LK42_9ROSI|nr:hypothetical protein NC652_035740 [Populus alba x Populus x berolinensis]KAJ6968470.1 hypothetical protein NC653_036445 [Populus alba x Populus x berolinensis]KAJ6968473.1 hypothetical protein NC653_036447 [Populus alba x Populus x berolinensis]